MTQAITKEQSDELFRDIVENDCYGIASLPEPKFVMDIGAHIGSFSMMCRQKWPKVRIDAYEPFQPQWDVLYHNSLFHDFSVFKLAVTRDGRQVKQDQWARTIQSRSGGDGEVVNSIRIDWLLDLHGGLFKIDIEGEEFNMLHDITKLAETNYVSVEIHGNRPGVDDLLRHFPHTVYGNRADIFVARIKPKNPVT